MKRNDNAVGDCKCDQFYQVKVCMASYLVTWSPKPHDNYNSWAANSTLEPLTVVMSLFCYTVCECSAAGTINGVDSKPLCDQNNSTCLCKAHTYGPTCQHCMVLYLYIPHNNN